MVDRSPYKIEENKGHPITKLLLTGALENMNLNELVVKRIKSLREENNFTQSYVAKKLGISQGAYSMLENGSTKITLDQLEELSQLFQIKVLQLFLDDAHFRENLSFAHSNSPPEISTMEKILYEKNIEVLEANVSRLYQLVEKLIGKKIDA